MTRAISATLAVAIAALVVGLISTGWQLADQPGTAAAPPARQSVLEGTILKAKPLCATGATTPFTPTRVSVEGVVHRAPVLALPRDSNNVPGVPPINEAGKHEFAWDRPPGVMPGSDKGNVLLTQGTLKATGALATAYLDADNSVTRVVITGTPAHIEQLDDSGNLMQGDATAIDYDNVKQVAVLTGNASVKQKGRGEARGDKLTYNTQTSQMTGESSGDGMVHMTFQPRPKPATPAASSSTPAAASPAPAQSSPAPAQEQP